MNGAVPRRREAWVAAWRPRLILSLGAAPRMTFRSHQPGRPFHTEVRPAPRNHVTNRSKIGAALILMLASGIAMYTVFKLKDWL